MSTYDEHPIHGLFVLFNAVLMLLALAWAAGGQFNEHFAVISFL
jgi:hypothetical protein